MKDRIISTGSYGICLFSPKELSAFLKQNGKGRTKKVLDLFQNNKSLYLESISVGSWVPIVTIDSIEYIIKVSNNDECFDLGWERVYVYNGFNISIDNDVWIASIGILLNWSEQTYVHHKSDTMSYQTLDGETLFSAFRYSLESGKYLLKIEGYKRKEKQGYPNANSGFLFSFIKVDKYTGYKDPREDDIYSFNSINR